MIINLLEKTIQNIINIKRAFYKINYTQDDFPTFSHGYWMSQGLILSTCYILLGLFLFYKSKNMAVNVFILIFNIRYWYYM